MSLQAYCTYWLPVDLSVWRGGQLSRALLLPELLYKHKPNFSVCCNAFSSLSERSLCRVSEEQQVDHNRIHTAPLEAMYRQINRQAKNDLKPRLIWSKMLIPQQSFEI